MGQFIMKVTTNYLGEQFVKGQTYNDSEIPDSVLDNWIEHGLAEPVGFSPSKFIPAYVKVGITSETDNIDKAEINMTKEEIESAGAGAVAAEKVANQTQETIDDGVRPYKVYTALLTQTGTDAPVATVLENTIGNIVWSRVNTGQYRATLNNAFDATKTIVYSSQIGLINFTPPSTFTYEVYLVTHKATGQNFVDIVVFDITGNPVDLNSNTTSIEIRVYP